MDSPDCYRQYSDFLTRTIGCVCLVVIQTQQHALKKNKDRKMNHKEHDCNKNLIKSFGTLSANIAQNHHRQNVAEFVFHDICSSDMLNINKAAYFVNNADFKILKGVVGYHQHDAFAQGNCWQNPEQFNSHMQNNAQFHQKVRNVEQDSIDMSNKKQIFKLADHLELAKPVVHTWNMKYDNQGIILFEQPEHDEHNHICQVAPLLSFCSVF